MGKIDQELDKEQEHVKIKNRSIASLMWIKFKRNKLASIGLGILVFLYIITTFCEFFSPYSLQDTNKGFENCPPTRIYFISSEGKIHLRPFVYAYKRTLDLRNFRAYWTKDTNKKYPIYFFVNHGTKYRILGILPLQSNLRLFNVKEGYIFLFGTDSWGRDIFSRVLYGGRVSLTIGWVGVLISLVLGVLIGAASGYLSGMFDIIIQRLIEVLISVPPLPLWLVLSAALPKEWNSIQVYFGIVIILSLISWTRLARIVRGMILAHRESEYVLAARNLGANIWRIIRVHLVPNISSYLLVYLTLSIPAMIIAETSLSFLGLGIRPPMTSWGSMLKEAQNVDNVIYHTWYLIPALFVIIAVLAFNSVGDGVRDAADPFSKK